MGLCLSEKMSDVAKIQESHPILVSFLTSGPIGGSIIIADRACEVVRMGDEMKQEIFPKSPVSTQQA